MNDEQNEENIDEEENSDSNLDNTRSPKVKDPAGKAKKLHDKYKNAKKNSLKFLKKFKSFGWLTTIISTVGSVLLIIFLIIGFIGFFTTLPGLAIDKVREACENFWRNLTGDDSIQMEGKDIDNLANYINDMGYDLVGYGFASPGAVTKDEETGKLKVDWQNSRIYNLYGYVLSNERTYAVQGAKQDFVKMTFGNAPFGIGALISNIDNTIRSNWGVAPQRYGLIDMSEDLTGNIFGQRKTDIGAYNVVIDRASNSLSITSNTGAFGLRKQQVKWSLDGWTSRYGKPIELSLALHLSTMSPDFVYNFCSNSDLQTRVMVKTKAIDYELTYKYQNTDENGNAVGEPILSGEHIDKYEAIEFSQIERMNALFNDGPYIGEINDRSLLTSLHIPYGVLTNNLCLISIKKKNESTYKIYTAVDKDGKSAFQFNDLINFNENKFDVKFDSETDQPYFERITNGSGGVTIYDFMNDNGCITPDGQIEIRMELLSVDLFTYFCNTARIYQPYFSLEDILSSIAEDGDAKTKCMNSSKYKKIFSDFDKLINPKTDDSEGFWRFFNSVFSIDTSISGIFDKDYRNKAEKLGLDSTFTFYNYKTEYDQVVLSDGTIKNVPKIIPVHLMRFSELNDENRFPDGVTHNTAEKWQEIIDYITQNNGENINYINRILNGEDDELGFKQYVIEEISKIKYNDNRTPGTLETGDETYLKMLALFSEELYKYLEDHSIDVQTFITLYNVFKDLDKEILVYKPYITKVVNHWYKDLDFSNSYEIFEPSSPSTPKLFNPEGAATDPRITQLQQSGKFYYIEKVKEGSQDVRQISQPKIIKDKDYHYMVKNWIKYGYYFIYDSTIDTAKNIDKARQLLNYFGYEQSNPLLINVNNETLFNSGDSRAIDQKAKEFNEKLSEFDSIVHGVRLKKIDLEKQDSLTAFTILESMHTKDSEYIYRDLKEFLIELGYFTRADFDSIETDVFKWIIPDYKVYKDEWPDGKIEKNKLGYGSYVHARKEGDKIGFKEGLEVIAPEKGEIIEVGNISRTEQTTENEESSNYTTSGGYVIIKFNTGNGVNEWKMKIEGINVEVSEGASVEQNTRIGTTTSSNIRILLYDEKDSIINDVEDYFKLTKKKTRGVASGEISEQIEALKSEGIEVGAGGTLPEAVARWEADVESIAPEYGLDTKLVLAMINQESGGNPSASNGAAYGLMQYENTNGDSLTVTKADGTVETLTDIHSRINSGDTDYQIRVGCAVLKNRLDEYEGNVAVAIQGYNYGPGGIRRCISYYLSGGANTNDLYCGISEEEYKNYIKSGDLGWLESRQWYTSTGNEAFSGAGGGDATYLESVLRYYI